MKQMRFVSLLATAVLLSSCAVTLGSNVVVSHTKPLVSESQKQMWKLMVGRWYGGSLVICVASY